MTGSATLYPTKTTVNSRKSSVTNRAAQRSVRYARPKSAAVRTRFALPSSGTMRPCRCTRLDQLYRVGTGNFGAASTLRFASPASTNRLSKFVVTRRVPPSVLDRVSSASWTRRGAVARLESRSMTVPRSASGPSRSLRSSRPSALSNCGLRRLRSGSSR